MSRYKSAILRIAVLVMIVFLFIGLTFKTVPYVLLIGTIAGWVAFGTTIWMLFGKSKPTQNK